MGGCVNMKNKFDMTREQSIFVVKRNIVDYIWKDANLEGIAITYPDTEAIYNGMSVQGYKVKDIVAVNNLKHAWQFIIDNVDYPIDYQFICKINQIVGSGNIVIEAGYLRKFPVKIGGTNWRPKIPDEVEIKESLKEINSVENATERAIRLMLYCMRTQMFYDGNKRTGMLAANHVMVANGAGAIVVPIEIQPIFTSLLVKFYETNNMDDITSFIYDNCIDGMEFPKEISQDRTMNELRENIKKERDNCNIQTNEDNKKRQMER